MRQLTFEEAGRYAWREVPEPEIAAPEHALVRPLMVACCDLDVAVCHGRLPLPPGYAVGHEGLAEVVAVGDDVRRVQVGDRVVVPFQISCGTCRECRRGVTGSCGSLPLMACYGMAPIAGLDGGGFMSDLVLVPYADAMLIAIPETVDPAKATAMASLSDNIPDAWRAIGPFQGKLVGLDSDERRVLVVGRLSIGLYAAAIAAALGAHVDYVDTDAQRLAAAEKLGAAVHDRAKPDKSWGRYPVTVNTSADVELLAATLRATWPDGVCTDTGIYYQPTVEMPLLAMYTRGVKFVTGRVNARVVIPQVLDLLADGLDLSPAVDRVVPWEDAPSAWPTMSGKTVFTRA
jgi:threonine dehydrogenase-like Zn-dependent dehydrogenase